MPLYFTITAACISKSTDKSTSEKFTPHPVIKEHQDVTTITIRAKAPDFPRNLAFI